MLYGPILIRLCLKYSAPFIFVGSHAVSSTEDIIKRKYLDKYGNIGNKAYHSMLNDSCWKIFPLGQNVGISSQENNHKSSVQADKAGLCSKYDSHFLIVVECFTLCLLLNVFHHACCGIFSYKLGFVRCSTEVVVEYLPTRLVVDWLPKA